MYFCVGGGSKPAGTLLRAALLLVSLATTMLAAEPADPAQAPNRGEQFHFADCRAFSMS